MKKFRKILTKDFLYKEYIINRKTLNQIAHEIGCSLYTIWYNLKKNNIPIRTQSEAMKGKYIGKQGCNYKNGKHSQDFINHCLDCEKEISCLAKRCRQHAGVKRWQNKERKTKLQKRMKLQWQDKEFREKAIKATFKANNITPNKPEILLIKLLNKILPNQYTFVGSGDLIINGFVPDFVNKDNNKIIELFGNYWHNLPDYKKRDKRRRIAYKKYGYNTLIIWEHELKDLEKVEARILKFSK